MLMHPWRCAIVPLEYYCANLTAADAAWSSSVYLVRGVDWIIIYTSIIHLCLFVHDGQQNFVPAPFGLFLTFFRIHQCTWLLVLSSPSKRAWSLTDVKNEARLKLQRGFCVHDFSSNSHACRDFELQFDLQTPINPVGTRGSLGLLEEQNPYWC